MIAGEKVGHAYFGVGKVLSTDSSSFRVIVDFGYPYGVRTVSLFEIQLVAGDLPTFGIA